MVERSRHERVRVAHLTTVDMSLALLLATELAADVEAGFEVFGVSAPGPYVARVEALGVTHVAIDGFTRAWDLRRDITAARQLYRTLRRLEPDVLHTHTPKAGVIGRLAGRMARVPVVVNTCHGLWAQPGDRWAQRALVALAEGAAARCSHFELYQNAEDLRAMRWAVPAARARLVGNGIDLDRFRVDPEGRCRMRRRWRVGDDELVVGTVGRRVAEKGIAELATAASALRGAARFVWVGPDEGAGVRGGGEPSTPGPPAPSTGTVEFVGPCADMPAVYSAIDVFVLPSHREGFSRSAMEAAACGRPMVLTDIRGCRQIGTDDEHLLLVPPRDAAAVTAAVARLLAEPELRSRLGAAAERRARQAFDQRAVAAASIETYRLVAARRGLPW